MLETLHETTDGAVRVIDFMPPRGEAPDIVRIVEGIEGTVAMRSELVIRFDYGKIVPWVRRVDHARVAIAGPDALCFRSPVEPHGENLTTVSEFAVAAGERVPFVLTWFPSHGDAARRDRRRSRRSPTPRATGATGRRTAPTTAPTTRRSMPRSDS